MKRRAVIVVLAGTLAGCGGGSAGHASKQEATYRSVDALHTEVLRAGVACDAFEKPRTQLAIVAHASDWADCGGTVELATYRSAAARDADVAAMRSAGLTPVVTGAGWIVAPAGAGDAGTLARALRGTVVR